MLSEDFEERAEIQDTRFSQTDSALLQQFPSTVSLELDKLAATVFPSDVQEQILRAGAQSAFPLPTRSSSTACAVRKSVLLDMH